jgi:GTP-binding protein Era
MTELPIADQHCGLVALIGAPNAGKSTLLNALVGTKVSIVSRKVQTTRTRVRGIAIEGNAQIVFVDTPGIFAPRRMLDRAMVRTAWTEAGDADLVVLLVDALRGLDDDAKAIIDGLGRAGGKAILALNKIDLMERGKLLSVAQQFFDTGHISDVFMISALNSDGTDKLMSHLAKLMPRAHWLYPADQAADMPLRQLAAEVTREQIYDRLHDELPYKTAVETDLWEERRDGSVRIDQTIFVERESQRAIVLGANGQTIKTLGARARAELEAMLERRVHLFLFVKVAESWAEDPERYRNMGLELPPKE